MKISSILLASALALAVAAPTGSAFAVTIKKEITAIKKDEKGTVKKIEKDTKAGNKKGVVVEKKLLASEEKKVATEKKLELKPKLPLALAKKP
jgi:hypothetical protein